MPTGGRTLLWIVLAGVLLLVLMLLLYAISPNFLRAGTKTPRESVLFYPDRPSINYEVFKPAILLVEDTIYVSNALADYFRPSNLRYVVCDFVPANPDRLLSRRLASWLSYCYFQPSTVPEAQQPVLLN